MSAVSEEPKMASQIVEDSPKIGSVLLAEVEQALPDVLMVSLKSGGKVFRGVLIDTSSGGMCQNKTRHIADGTIEIHALI